MFSGISPSTAAAAVKEGLSYLPEDAINHLGTFVAAGAGNPIAGAFLSLAFVGASGVVETKADQLTMRVDMRLSELADQLDESDPKQAVLLRGIDGVLRCLPDYDELTNGIVRTVNRDAEALEALIDLYGSEPDRRRELEEAIELVFSGDAEAIADHGDYETFLDYFKDVFDAETKDDALRGFLDMRQLMLSNQVHEVLETTSAIEIDIDRLTHVMERTQKELDARLDSILEANLRDEGFVRLSPHYFDRHQPPNPATSWRTGFDLAAVHEGQALVRQYATEDGRREVREDLDEHLLTDGSIVVVGRPGTGKSTICKTLACHWYDQRRGTVFYRESDTGHRFSRTGVLEERIRGAEGHVLVVVEDAARENANAILQVMLEFRDDPGVSFLLDSRVEEWADLTRTITNTRILNLKQELTQYTVPKFDEDECARAVTLFERSTGHQVVEEADELLAEVRTDIGVGEMYLLGYRLSSYDFHQYSETTGLLNEVQHLYSRLEGRQDELIRELAMLINILNAAELSIHPEVLHALVDTDAEHRRVEETIDEFTGLLLFKRAGRYQSHHPFWSTQYLSYALDRGEHTTIHLFEDCLNAVFELVDDPKKRMQVRQWHRGSRELEFLSDIQKNPMFVANSLVQDIFELGRRQPGLAPLFNTSDQSAIQLPSVCSPEVRLNSTRWRGEMYLEKGEPEVAEREFERFLEQVRENEELSTETRHRLTGQGYLNLGEFFRKQGELENARQQLEQSLEVFDTLDSPRWKAQAYAELGVIARRSGNLNEADEYYDRSIELCRQVDYRFGEAKALNNRGMVEKDRGNLEKARADLERAIELKRSSGHHRASRAISRNTLGEIFYQQGELDEAETHLKRSLQMKQEVDYQPGIAWSLYYLGLVEIERDNLDTARDHLIESFSIRRDIDDELGMGRCLNALGKLYFKLGELPRSEAYHWWSLEKMKNVGDTMGQARYEVYVGNIAFERGELTAASDHYQSAVERFEKIGNNRGLADSYRGLARIAKQLNDYQEAKEYLEMAIEELDDLSAERYKREAIDELIAVCEEGDMPREALDWRRKIR